jgi:adenine/guanine phosphoribosyltransferase-like PRPP-binding protein
VALANTSKGPIASSDWTPGKATMTTFMCLGVPEWSDGVNDGIPTVSAMVGMGIGITSLADVLPPQLGVLGDERAEQLDAFGVVEIENLDAEPGQPVVAARKGARLPDHNGADPELSDEAAAIPTGRQRGHHDGVPVTPPAARRSKRSRLRVSRRVLILHAAVMPTSKQNAVAREECRAYRDATLTETRSGLGDRCREPRASGIRVERGGPACAHRRAPAKVDFMSDDGRRTYLTVVGSQEIELPLVEVAKDLSIALLISVDHGLAFSERAGAELAALMAPYEVEMVASVATMGIPLAIEVTRALGLDDYAILHKTPKIHLADAVSEPVKSITTASQQRLLFDRARIDAIAGKRVGIVDDVISTGGSSRAALNLVRRVGGEPVVFGALLTEGSAWRDMLGPDADKVRALGSIPVFRHEPDGSLTQDWGPPSA